MDIKIGQIYMDNDPRNKGRRTFVVTGSSYAMDGTRYIIGDVFRDGATTGRKTNIREDRFKPTNRGYKLLDVHNLPKTELKLKQAELIITIMKRLRDTPVARMSTVFRTFEREVERFEKL